jgi:hypothetical protein
MTTHEIVMADSARETLHYSAAWGHLCDAVVELRLAGATDAEALTTMNDALIWHDWKREQYRQKVAESKQGLK